MPRKSNESSYLIIGATNHLESLDPAILRRFPVRIELGLPKKKDRRDVLNNFFSKSEATCKSEILETVSLVTEGYSMAELNSLCRWAVCESINPSEITDFINKKEKQDITITLEHFMKAMVEIKPATARKI